MKNYTSLGTSPITNYIRFKDEDSGKGKESSLGGLGGLGGLADNHTLLRLEKHDERKSREIIGNSINNISIIRNQKGDDISGSAGDIDTSCKTIVIPFYCCLIDIIITNDLYVEIVDNGSIETKNCVLANGKIKKYRVNGSIKDYNIYVEFCNENVYHVQKRGIMMRVKVTDELRKLIINTMVNYTADSGDVNTRKSGSGGSGVAADSNNKRGGTGGTGGRGWFGWLSCFTSRNE